MPLWRFGFRATLALWGGSVLAVGSAVMAVERAIMAVRHGSGGVPLGLWYVGVGSGGWKCHYGG